MAQCTAGITGPASHHRPLPAVAARLKKALLFVFMLIGMSLEDYTCCLLLFYSFGYWGD